MFVPGTWRFVVIGVVAAVAASFVWLPLTALVLAATLGVTLFFRDPDRDPPTCGVLAPADGTVTVLREEGEQLRVGVFMNVTDVHVNRAPLSATVESVTHETGAHRPALSKESDRNERVTIDCGDHEIALIAGWFARRIHPYVAAGDRIDRGDRIGHISFGSRTDVVLPATIDREHLAVSQGDTVRAGETVIASHPDTDP
ncbi:MAG: protein sorting system archaetidylserine decarboxylase [Halobacteriaceae archaeon]